MKLITYNIRKGKGPSGRETVEMARIAAALGAEAAELVLCQEVFHCSRTGASQTEQLADGLCLKAYYGANKHRTVGHHGNTTFTALPVAYSANHDISTNPIERRGAMYVRSSLHGRPLHIFNVHLGLNGFQRATQVKTLAGLLEQLVAPADAVIVAGDFNDWREQLEARMAQELGLSNALAAAPGPAPKTWHARRPMLPLDRIYIRNLQVQRAGRLVNGPWADLSDHLPLYAELEPA